VTIFEVSKVRLAEAPEKRQRKYAPGFTAVADDEVPVALRYHVYGE
jgi:hypothetical protein